jgi:4-amino-4-deoxy-L-arabinose transferase-like glycosyltransferase
VKPLQRSTVFLLGFFLAALAWRAAFLPACDGSYTDGILQVECFRYGLTYWPPLYALMARVTSWIPGFGLEGGGRAASLLAGALVMLPLGAMGRRLFGLRAAFWAMAAWLVAPMALRWSLQVMTDMPMTALWTGALAALVIAVEAFLPELFPDGQGRAPRPRQGLQWLALATLLGVLAALTRYQGVLLAPLTLLAAWRLAPVARARGGRPGRLWATQLGWLLVVAWALRHGTAPLANHFAQIHQRAGDQGAMFSLVQVYLNMFESFLLLSPYFFAYGLFGFMLFGLLRVNWATARLRWLGWMALGLTLAVLALQSVFSSFQERYLLPLLPLACLFAGHGLATWERHCEGRQWRFWGLAGPTLAHALVMGALVGAWQGTPFRDIKQAARFIRDHVSAAAGRRVVTNEFYNDKIGAVKVNFWSGGRPVTMLGTTRLVTGDLVLVSSFYAGGPDPYMRLIQTLKANPAIEPMHAPFGCRSIPLFPDLMPEPYNQNPMAWNLRYAPQSFQTTVFRVRGYDEVKPTETPPPIAPTGPTTSEQRLKELQTRIHDLRSTETTQRH